MRARLAAAGLSDADAAVAAAWAAHDALARLFPDQAGIVGAALEATTLDAGDGPSVEAGRAVGAAAAAAVLADRKGDGADVAETWVEQDGAGHFRHVPGWEVLAAPHWRAVRPFALEAPDQFRTAPPPALDSAAYAADFAEWQRRAGRCRRNAQPRRAHTPRSGTSSRTSAGTG